MNKTIFPLTLILAFIALGGVTSGVAHSYKQGDISIGHIWAPVTVGQGEAGVFGPLLNTGTEGDALISAHSPMAQSAHFAEQDDEGNTATLEQINLAPGKPVSLASWSAYIRLEELSTPLEAGDSFPLTLVFEKAGEITVDVKVEAESPDH